MNAYKILLFGISGFLIVSAILFVSIGMKSVETLKEYDKLYKAEGNIVSLIIAIGVFIGILGLLSGIGALIEFTSLVFVFCILLGVLIVFELFSAAAIFFMSNKTDEWVEKALVETAQDYNKTDSEEITEGWDNLHKKLKCCGVNGVKTWEKHQYLQPDIVPDSCCKEVRGSCGYGAIDKPSAERIYVQGCYEVLRDVVKSLMNGLIILSLVFAGSQGIAIIIAFKASAGFR